MIYILWSWENPIWNNRHTKSKQVLQFITLPLTELFWYPLSLLVQPVECHQRTQLLRYQEYTGSIAMLLQRKIGRHPIWSSSRVHSKNKSLFFYIIKNIYRPTDKCGQSEKKTESLWFWWSYNWTIFHNSWAKYDIYIYNFKVRLAVLCQDKLFQLKLLLDIELNICCDIFFIYSLATIIIN